jgi:hypothetical protein
VICNLETAFGAVSPTLCKNWSATLHLALATGKTVTVWYPDSPAACSALAAYGAAPVPGYVLMYGP